MSHRTMPLLFLNLGGEMMYILDQRLQAQSIPKEKANTVKNDIIGMMMNRKFIDELFKPQEMYPKRSMKTMFDRLAHASIMRLNSASMDKLYDLMTMAFKYQVYMCPHPKDLFYVTMNHFNALAQFATGPSLKEQLSYVNELLVKNYFHLSSSEWQFLRQTILKFFQDVHTKVSVFLKDNRQTQNGWFVLNPIGPIPHGSEIPGSIRYFDDSGFQQSSSTFPLPAVCKYEAPLSTGSEYMGDSKTILGTNIYKTSGSAVKAVKEVAKVEQHKKKESQSTARLTDSESVAAAELKLLTHLLGGSRHVTGPVFKLNLFDVDEDVVDRWRE
ncbi:protein OSCP1-like isoform X2 [Oscarella lobularis]|uniref:protein OSCP1-like isoform X2 n=1 Tax=Oscarella lobularis TaxID=121494 RepID=UPI0033134B07